MGMSGCKSLSLEVERGFVIKLLLDFEFSDIAGCFRGSGAGRLVSFTGRTCFGLVEMVVGKL